MNWLTMKVLQYIAGALLIACIGLGAKGCSLSSDLKLATAEKNTALADKKTAETERDSWKSKTADAEAANRAYDVAFGQLEANAAEQQRQAALQAQQSEKAIAASRAKADAANRELADFRRMYGQRPAGCEAALKSLDRACPAWRY